MDVLFVCDYPRDSPGPNAAKSPDLKELLGPTHALVLCMLTQLLIIHTTFGPLNIVVLDTYVQTKKGILLLNLSFGPKENHVVIEQFSVSSHCGCSSIWIHGVIQPTRGVGWSPFAAF